MQGIPYSTVLRKRLADVYDAYILLLHFLEKHVAGALGQDQPNWRLQNSCPACEYKLQDEPQLPLSRLICGDGNNSSKRFAHAGHQDTRVYESDYIIPPEEVDRFKDDVQSRHSQKRSRTDTGGDPTDGLHPEPIGHISLDESLAACADKWKAAQARETAHTFQRALDETGHFLTVCRHAFIRYSVDMVRSGELAKYSLASLDRLMSILGPDIGFGYDIGCTHLITVLRSSLGERARQNHLRFFVGAFHGYAHNRRCQIAFHPRLLATAGLEDFETCEWVFSQQNRTAHLFRHASGYHRHMTMDWFYRTWDADRRAALGDFLFRNYQQALSITRKEGAAVTSLMQSLGLTVADLEQFREDEKSFFNSLEHPPEINETAVQYLQALKLHAAAEAELNEARSQSFIISTPQNWDHSGSQQRNAQTRERNILRIIRKVQQLETVLVSLENTLDTERWTPEHPAWQQYSRTVDERDFQQALDHLENLVVQRLFEMEKMNTKGTNYKMRSAIAKALQARSHSLRTALSAYNRLAITVNPPRDVLTMEQVLDYAFLAEFSLLRYGLPEKGTRLWMQPHIRELLTKWMLVRCAEQEIARLNVEIRRVMTAIDDDRQQSAARLALVVKSGDVALAHELRQRIQVRQLVDSKLQRRLEDIMRLPGYSGLHGRGIPLRPRPSPETMDRMSTNFTLADAGDREDLDSVTEEDSTQWDGDERPEIEALAEAFGASVDLA